MKRAIVFAAATIGVLMAAPSAFASTAEIDGATLEVRAQGNEKNVITVSYAAGTQYVVTDTAGVTAQAGCLPGGANRVICADTGVTSIDVDAASKNDTVSLTSSIPTNVIGDLRGGSGSDRLFGGPGRELLDGEAGSDLLDGGLGADSMSGGNARDTVQYVNRTAGVNVTVGAGANDGNSQDQTGAIRDSVGGDIEIIRGGTGNDTIIGSDGDEILSGRAGNDVIRAGAGDDVVRGKNGDDFLVGKSGDDRVKGGLGVDVMKGKNGIDRLLARDGTRDRRINCGGGDDSLEFAKVDGVDPRAKRC